MTTTPSDLTEKNTRFADLYLRALEAARPLMFEYLNMNTCAYMARSWDDTRRLNGMAGEEWKRVISAGSQVLMKGLPEFFPEEMLRTAFDVWGCMLRCDLEDIAHHRRYWADVELSIPNRIKVG